MKGGGKARAGPSSWLRAMAQTPPTRPAAPPGAVVTAPSPHRDSTRRSLSNGIFPVPPPSPLPGGIGGARAAPESHHEEATDWDRMATDQGSAETHFQMGRLYQKGQGGYQTDAEAAANAWFRRAAHQGHAAAQCSLGWQYEAGLGVQRNEVFAAMWYERAAVQGHAAAQFGLGYLYEKGSGVERNEEMATAWYAKGAAQAPPPRIVSDSARTFYEI